MGIPRHDVQTSRWRASPTTFGPIGRLVVTAGVFGLLIVGLFWTGASPFGLWFFLAWSIVAGFVLRQTWQAVRVDVDPHSLRMRFGRRFPRLTAPLPLRTIASVIGVSILAAGAYGWATGDTLARFSMVILGVMLGLTWILLHLTDS